MSRDEDTPLDTDLSGRLKELRAIAEAATQGPWVITAEGERGSLTRLRASHPGHGANIATTWIKGSKVPQSKNEANAKHICAFAPKNAIELLCALQAAQAREAEALPEIERLKGALTELVALKDLKDSQGKTLEYATRQRAAWLAARSALQGSRG